MTAKAKSTSQDHHITKLITGHLLILHSAHTHSGPSVRQILFRLFLKGDKSVALEVSSLAIWRLEDQRLTES
jgi:hypothetical protein